MTTDGPRFRVALRGYDRSEVDALCERIERTLAGTAGTDAVTADDIRGSSFDIVLRGYDPRRVDEHFDEAVARLPAGPARDAAGAPDAADADVAAESSTTSWTESLRERHDLLQVAERPSGERFARTRLREGYDLGEVDAFVERVRATLVTTLTADEVHSIEFTTVRLRLGYDMEAVDIWLDAVQRVAKS